MIARSRMRLSLGLLGAALTWLAVASGAAAHEGVEVGDFVLTIGWREEPALVGQPNAVQVLVTNHDTGAPVNTGVDLSAVVSSAGQSSPALALTPQFVVGESGTPGDYGADLIPTSPGDYTFHITGTVRDTEVDVEMTSGEETFSPVIGASDLEFPVKLPSTGEIVTRLDRIDGRIAALQSGDPGQGPGVGEAVAAANAATDAARSATTAANQALLVGAGLGVAGVLIGLLGVALALRAGRGRSGAA